MKKHIAFLLAVTAAICSLWAKEINLKPAEIPQEITAFVKEHFKEQKIIRVIKETEGVKVSYDAILDNGTKLEFNGKKTIIDIEHHSKLPDSVVPVQIRAYVAKEYAEESVIAWELDRKKQSVTLTNGLELEFTLKGEFIKIDR